MSEKPNFEDMPEEVRQKAQEIYDALLPFATPSNLVENPLNDLICDKDGIGGEYNNDLGEFRKIADASYWRARAERAEAALAVEMPGVQEIAQLYERILEVEKREVELQAELAAVKESNRWHQVENKMPEIEEMVLVVDVDIVRRGFWQYHGMEVEWRDADNRLIEVYWWHPLPALPWEVEA